MKNHIYLIILIVCAAAITTFSQSTEIRPGTVLPQMTTAQRSALASPINGTLVFDSTTQSYWYRQSGAWVELPKGGSTANYWQLSGLGGNELKNTNSGGIWSANPTGLSYYTTTDVSNPPTAPINGNGTRLMWIPSRSAFRVGTVFDGRKSWDADSIGLFSFASGINAKASGTSATAMGIYINASGQHSTALGLSATASGYSSTAIGYRVVASGYHSTAMGYTTTASGSSSTAIGVFTNATGYASTAMGFLNTASGEYSTVMGARTSTNNKVGSFVIGDFVDNTGDTLSSTATNQFSARFENGYQLYTDNNLSATTKYGVVLFNRSNSWGILSDSTKKERFVTYDPQKVLNSVAAMRVGTWNYKGDDRPEGRHWGVMAQDFYHHFGTDKYGTIGSDTLIATADFDGVSFAAIKALELRTRELQQENERLKEESMKLKNELAAKDEKYANLFSLLNERVKVMEESSKATTKAPVTSEE